MPPPYNWDDLCPRGGIGIRGRLRACAHMGVSVRVGAGAPTKSSVGKDTGAVFLIIERKYPVPPGQAAKQDLSPAPC